MSEEKAVPSMVPATDGEYHLDDGTVLKIVDGKPVVTNPDAPKPLFDHGRKWKDGKVLNTVHTSTDKFSVGQEVRKPDGTVGRVTAIEGDVYTVTIQITDEFHENELSAEIPLDAE